MSSNNDGCTVRLAGVQSDVTELALERRGPNKIWPIFEDSNLIQHVVSKYAGRPQVPIFWQVDNRSYSRTSSWKGMRVPSQWLFDGDDKSTKLLYLEADATSGDDASALALMHDALLL